jgi:hypothetical protein
MAKVMDACGYILFTISRKNILVILHKVPILSCEETLSFAAGFEEASCP